MSAIRCRRRNGVLLISGVLLFLLAVLGYVFFMTGQVQKWRDLHGYSSYSYNGAFFAMYDISSYSEEDFVTYRGVPTVKAGYTIKKWGELSKYLNTVLSSPNTVTNVFMGLNPMVLWEDSREDEAKWTKNLNDNLITYVMNSQDVSFEILLPAFSLQYWLELNPDQIEERLDVFYRFIDDMSAYANVSIYFVGGEQWAIANPGNYLEKDRPNQDLSKDIFLHVICDHGYQITPVNAATLFDRLTSLVEKEREASSGYPDLSGWCMVFFGESPLDYYTGSYSITGVVNGLSGAQVYNCGKGGVPATDDPKAVLSLNRMIERFLKNDTDGLDEGNNFLTGLTAYMQEGHEDKKYCFVVAFGLNDYFGGHPVENPEDAYDTGTYAGALRSGVRTLKEAYPDAEILLMAPTYTSFFSEGTETNSEVGGVLTDYVDATVRAAEEMGVHCMNNYADSGINAENHTQYLADGCHPNETGAFLLGTQIVEFMERIVTYEE